MLSRRSVRIKIMQLLYAKDRDSDLTLPDLQKKYVDSINESFNLLIFVTYLLIQITERSVGDAEKRKTKHLPTDFDKAFSAKLHTNEIITSLNTNKNIQSKFKKLGYADMGLDDFMAKMYQGFSKTEPYRDYILAAETKERDLEILLELFRYLRSNEYFNEICDDKYLHWFDEKSLVVGTLKKILKAQPIEGPFIEQYFPDDDTIKEYGEKLLTHVAGTDEKLTESIIPFLENWDSERLAVIDMILMKMALSEQEIFESIPSTVTINEYVEVAKAYSTDKSKEFVNGVLDKLFKQLAEK